MTQLIGPVKRAANMVAFSAVIISFLTMTAVMQWQKYKLRKSLPDSGSNRAESDLLKTTGTFTVLTLSVVLGQSLFLFIWSSNGQTYHLAKDLVTNSVVFVVTPAVLLFRNKKMVKFVSQMFPVFTKTTQALAMRDNKICPGVVALA